MPDITPPTVSMRTSVTHFATVGFTGYSNAIYITLSEPSTNFNSSDLTVVNGGVGGLVGFTGSGTEYKAYFPFFKVLPSMITSSLNEIVVFSLAPVLHNFPKGTKLPKTGLPFAPGRE